MFKQKFTIFVEDYNVPAHPWLFWHQVFGQETYKMSRGKISVDGLFIFEKSKVLWGPDQSQFIAAGNYFHQKIIKDKNFFTKIIREHLICFKEIKNFSRKIIKANLKLATDKQLLKLYLDYRNLWIRTGKAGCVPLYLDMSDNKLSDKIKLSAPDKLRKFGELESVFSRLITPLRKTYIYQEQESLLTLLIKWKKKTVAWRLFINSDSCLDLPTNMRLDLKRLAKRFGFLQFYYDGQAADESYYFNALKRVRQNPEKLLNKKKQERLLLKSWQASVLKNLDNNLKYQIKILQESSFLKEARKETQIYLLNYAIHFWFKEVARRLYTTPTLAKYLLPTEIITWLRTGNCSAVKKLHERYQSFALLLHNNKEYSFSGAAALQMKKAFIKNEKTIKNTNKLSGSVAYSGKVRGEVKVVNSLLDLQKFNKGNILVSFSTNPSLMPAMNKAAAIITNTGGVTCHAAIVSRELEIPCIIDTKVATKVLKDGDLVEVDADQGVIKIIKRR